MGGSRGWIILVCVALALGVVASDTKVPAIFIFGDSTVDVGTNNYLKLSLAKANKPYYGIDYPFSRPTGRFSNGYNTADLIGTTLHCTTAYIYSPVLYKTSYCVCLSLC